MRSILVLLLACPLTAATYYVDSAKGADSNQGLSAKQPWKSLAKVNATDLAPGDQVLFQRGSIWQGQLAPKGSGKPGAPIVIDSYGKGSRPRIEAAGAVEDAVRLYNIQHIELRGLEITNHGDKPAVRRGVHIFLDNFGTASHIVVKGLYIHDVNGSQQHKDNGGIIFRTKGERVPSRFDGLLIEGNIVWRVDRSAIAAESYHWRRTHWFPSLNVIIRDNLVDDIGGDGIVPWATQAALVEHNIARNCNRRAATYNAAIWPWSADETVFRLNEAAFTRTAMDGQGFDSDFNSRGTLFQYNYSHDNEGGFLLICTPGKRDAAQNIGNIGTTVRHNISRNDLARIFHFAGAAEHTVIEDNAIYVGKGIAVQMVLTTDWDGWANGAVIKNNRFFIDGTATYGHQVSRHADGTYGIELGYAPAQGIVLENNTDKATRIEKWDIPEFDPAKPEGFEAFLATHRKAMTRLIERQFGQQIP
jgi:hypothetical protein